MKKDNLIIKPFKIANKYIAKELYIPKAFRNKIIIEENQSNDKKQIKNVHKQR